MAVNQDLTILEEDVLEDMEDRIEVETPEMTEAGKSDTGIRITKIATADVVDGKYCKT
jgi:hypothetical protein